MNAYDISDLMDADQRPVPSRREVWYLLMQAVVAMERMSPVPTEAVQLVRQAMQALP